MRCAACGFENASGIKFCGECGAGLKLKCPNCGFENAAGIKFCGECGKPLGEAAKPAVSPPDLRSYTPKHLAEKILTSRSALEGERKQVTVLFADVRGSTELAGELDPEEWHAILDRFFSILSEGVHRYEGTVNQYTGDGIMALFGAPIAHEDHAQRACYTALHLRDALRECADELRLGRGLSLSVRIGLNSGEVVVGKIGDDLRMDYTAQGQVVNVAQRIEQVAESGRVFLAKATADRVSGFFRLREVGPTEIKGLREPVWVYELEAAGEVQSRFDVTRARGLSKFVGREREMAQLEAALERALRGSGQFVGIVAEAGTGKSRLVYEFSERCRQRGLRVLTVSCPPPGQSVPMGLLLATASRGFGLLESDDRQTARQKVEDIMRVDPQLREDIPFMLDCLGLADSDSPFASMTPELRQREYLRIAERLVTRDDHRLRVFEDRHWIDAASEQIGFQLNRIDLPNPRLKVYTYRPGYRPLEADWPEYEEIRLKPFTAEATGELLRDLLGNHLSVDGVESLIEARAAGNPFYVEEIVQSLVESGQLEGPRGARKLIRPIDQVEVPESVQALLASRIDRLDERTKAVVQAAAVIGLEFPVAALEEVTGVGHRDLDAALETLTRAELVYKRAAYPEVEYAFKHPLTQQVAYETQLREPRSRLHGKIASLFERRYADRLDEKAGLIAHHWQEADERSQAARWYARAARWLESRHVPEALRHWRLTRMALGAEANTSEDRELAMLACREILSLGWRHGMDDEKAARVFEEGVKLARDAGDWRAEAQLLGAISTINVLRGRLREGLDDNSRALKLASAHADLDLTLELEGVRLYFLWVAGRPREVLTLVEHAGSRPFEPGMRERRAGGRVLGDAFKLLEGISLISVGRFREAYRSLEETLELARRYGDIDSTFALEWLAECSLELGDPEGALRFARECVKKAQEYHNIYAALSADRVLGTVLLACHHASEAWAALDRGLASAHAHGTGLQQEADFLQLLAAALLETGQRERARESCAEAIVAARRSGMLLHECDAHLVRARIALSADPLDSADATEAASALDRAEALIEETGAEGRRPRLLELRAELARAQGDEVEHAQLLREAERLLIEMGAPIRAADVVKELAR